MNALPPPLLDYVALAATMAVLVLGGLSAWLLRRRERRAAARDGADVHD